MRIPLITAHEWRSIAPLLPPTNGPGKTRHGDRLYVSAFYYAEAPLLFGKPAGSLWQSAITPDQAATLGTRRRA